MSEKNIDIVEELLPRYCEGNVSAEEREKVEKWIRQSEEHYKIARQIQLIYLASDTISVMDRVNTDNALSKVDNRIFRSQLKALFIWGQRVAAILFIPLLVAYLLQVLIPEKQDIRMLEVRTNPGMTTSLTLPDGTKVNLNSESSLVYPESFEGEFRSVRLEGEAFFEVVKNPEKRFVVTTPHNASVEVWGTSFNMEAFRWDSIVSTTLISGKVAFISKSGQVDIKPGEKLVYNIQTNRSDIYQTSGEAEISWKDGMIIFKKTPFEEALRMLTKRFNVDFVVSNNKYVKDFFTGSFTNHRLEQILDIFNASSGIKWRYIPSENKLDRKSKVEIY
ncbi:MULTISPECIES: FecR family protein [Parabacteroides]|jgi:fe2+-dicitrate sensor, membrane component|uniref:FecR family protein n=1 Tax=Parabacteroides TaxID=375288 RepID=UPI000EFEA47E|nr:MULTISPECIES: FecR family protein [Parabacteroides]RGY95478.1 FecR family protein [Parabacteroides sp. AM58-2XD]RKU64107.1 FecR family protein [Parabacteroides sp. AF17-3]GKG75691.1 anti-sigma factor [Parabacteroides goldsteinii]GKG80901.1 anti-sigma factor [Parabacteroides goldsteinii]